MVLAEKHIRNALCLETGLPTIDENKRKTQFETYTAVIKSSHEGINRTEYNSEIVLTAVDVNQKMD